MTVIQLQLTSFLKLLCVIIFLTLAASFHFLNETYRLNTRIYNLKYPLVTVERGFQLQVPRSQDSYWFSTHPTNISNSLHVMKIAYSLLVQVLLAEKQLGNIYQPYNHNDQQLEQHRTRYSSTPNLVCPP